MLVNVIKTFPGIELVIKKVFYLIPLKAQTNYPVSGHRSASKPVWFLIFLTCIRGYCCGQVLVSIGMWRHRRELFFGQMRVLFCVIHQIYFVDTIIIIVMTNSIDFVPFFNAPNVVKYNSAEFQSLQQFWLQLDIVS